MCNPCQFEWARIPDLRLLNPFSEDADIDDTRFIYKLHKAIELNPNNDRKYVENMVHKFKKLDEALSR